MNVIHGDFLRFLRVILLIVLMNVGYGGTLILANSDFGNEIIEQEKTVVQAGMRQHMWQEKPRGFLWYDNTTVQGKINEAKPKASILTKINSKEPHDLRIEALKQRFDRATKIALDNPTLENVIAAQRLQKEIMEKSQRFATMWQLATIIDYKLTNMAESSNPLHKRLYQQHKAEENADWLESLSKDWGLILQISPNCPYCISFAPIVRGLAGKFNFQLLAVSSSGEDFYEMQGMKDTGFLRGLNPEGVVPVLYLISSDGKKIYPIARGFTDEEKIIENIMELNAHYQKLARNNVVIQ